MRGRNLLASLCLLAVSAELAIGEDLARIAVRREGPPIEVEADEGLNFAFQWNGMLIVRESEEAHGKIAKHLDARRRLPK